MLMNTVLKNIKLLVNSSVIKFSKIAKEYETLESIENSDMYISAVQKTDRFDLYNEFDLDVIILSNITADENLQIQYATDPSTIPSHYRDHVLNTYRQYIINNYVEINNYYRMLNGLPNIEESESEFIRLTEAQRNAHEISNDTYIHLLSDIDIYKITESGLLNTIIVNNPTKKYLNYLGTNKIDIVQARITNNFGILKISTQDVPDEFYNTFIQMYDQNREYFMSVLYIPNYSDSYDMYDNFIGLCIMLMTIQRVISNTFKFGIQREFYDWSFIRNMYKTYNIPFIESLPIEYQVTLLKNLNNLLRYKSTDKVLFDIASLLGYERLNIFKYYLVKKHRLDNNEEPIFYYKQQRDVNNNLLFDEDNNPIYEEDKERMYELYFQRVNLKERNITLALQDESNKISYNEVTLNDPYWWEDSNLSDLKYNNTYNYVETKYISLNLMYKLTEMLFEITYAFRMMIDRKEDIDDIRIGIPKIYADAEFKLFDVVIFMIALLCKNHGFRDGLVTTPSMISHIYGFNFNEETINAIKSIIVNNPKIIDQSLLNYFNNLEITQASDVNALFVKIRSYNSFILEKMRNAKSIKEYHLYKDIFNISMISETQTEMFKITVHEDDTVVERTARTYLEYLEITQPILAEIVTNTERDDIAPLIDHIIAQINNFMEDMQYMFILNDNNNPVFTAILSLIKFFKSYTVDLNSFNILYIFDSKYYNMFKMVEDVHLIDCNMQINETSNHLYADSIQSLVSNLKSKNDIIKFNEKYKTYIRLSFSDELLCRDIIQFIFQENKVKDTINLENKLHIDKDELIKSVLNITDKFILDMGILNSDNLTIREVIKSITGDYTIKEEDTISDLIRNISKESWIKELDLIKEKSTIHVTNNYSDSLINAIEKYNIIDIIILYQYYLRFDDTINHFYKESEMNDTLMITDKIGSIISNHIRKEKLNLIEKFYNDTHIKYSGNLDHSYATDMHNLETGLTLKENLKLRDKVILMYED